MATYSVYVPYGIGGAGRRADRTIFIREGFSVAAFLFGPLYLLHRRLWREALGWAVAAAAILGLAHALALGPAVAAALFVLLQWLTGSEATTLRHLGLGRRGYYFAALLARPSLEQAEHGFFNGEGLREEPGRAPPARGADGPPEPPEVIGLFPRAGGA